ncbi:MAG TPA: ABC transporter permease [Methanocella sp.]
MQLSNIIKIMAKDAKLSMKNMSLLIVVLIAIFLPVIMSLMMGSITASGNETVAIGIVDRGNNHNYTDFLKTVSLYNVSFYGLTDDVNQSIKNGAIVGGIDIPANFDSDIAAGNKPSLTLLTDSTNLKSLIFTESCKELTLRYAGLEYPVSLQTQSVVQVPSSSSGSEVSPGYSGFTAPTLLLISIIIVGVSVLPATLTTEKEKKTITALMAAPVTQMDVILGKSLFGLLVTVLVSVIVLFLSNSITGNLPLAAVFVLLGAIAFNGIGLLISIYASSYQTASIISSVIMTPLMLFTFMYSFIDELKIVGAVLPNVYLMNGLNDAIVYNKDVSTQWVNLLVFTAITVAIYAIIYVSLRRKGLAS